MPKPAFIDLHCHTIFSDGSFTPEDVVGQAADAGVVTLAITDHDEVDYWDRASAAADAKGIQLIPGVELSAHHRRREVHILGYGFDPKDETLRNALHRFRDQRRSRAERIIAKLQGLGMNVDLSDCVPPDFTGAIGRPHVAKALMEGGHVGSVQEAFDLYLANGKPAFADKNFFSPEEACMLLRKAGGLPVIAHPALCDAKDWLGELADAGLGGVEVMHSSHGPQERATYSALADRYGLVKTGGCDFHGAVKPNVHFGDVQTPVEWLEPVERAISEIQAAAGLAA